MDLLQNGVDRSVIALWLGHESMDSTQVYLHASLELKEKALAKTTPFASQPRRYRPPDQLLAFLLLTDENETHQSKSLRPSSARTIRPDVVGSTASVPTARGRCHTLSEPAMPCRQNQ
jgi:hypothetical protein